MRLVAMTDDDIIMAEKIEIVSKIISNSGPVSSDATMTQSQQKSLTNTTVLDH